MKKLLLSALCASAFLFASCSSEAPDPVPSTVSARIDGEEVFFNTIDVNPVTYTEDGHTYTDLHVAASVDNDPSLLVTFIVEKNVTGPNAAWYFTYFLNQTAFPKMPGFELNVEENAGNQLKGTFSGMVKADVEPFEVVEIEDGTFDIVY